MRGDSSDGEVDIPEEHQDEDEMSLFLKNKQYLEEEELFLNESGMQSFINQSILIGDDEFDLEDSKIIQRSSMGLENARKSVIQQQSEKYIMKKTKNLFPSSSNSQGKLAN